MNVDPKNQITKDHDSYFKKGHAGVGLFRFSRKRFLKDILKSLSEQSKLSGHISANLPGVEFSTGSLVMACQLVQAALAKMKRKIKSLFY